MPSQLRPRKSPTSISSALLICIVITIVVSIALLGLLAWHCLIRDRHQPRFYVPNPRPPAPQRSHPPPNLPPFDPPELPHPQFSQNSIPLSKSPSSHPSHPTESSRSRTLTPNQKSLLDRLQAFPMESDTTATATELGETTPREVVNRSFASKVEKREREGNVSGLSARERMLLGSDDSTVTMHEEWARTWYGSNGERDWRNGGEGREAWRGEHDGRRRHAMNQGDRNSDDDDDDDATTERDDTSSHQTNDTQDNHPHHHHTTNRSTHTPPLARVVQREIRNGRYLAAPSPAVSVEDLGSRGGR